MRLRQARKIIQREGCRPLTRWRAWRRLARAGLVGACEWWFFVL